MRLIIAIHDITPARLGRACLLRDMVRREVPGPASLLVVPRYAGVASWRSGDGARRLAELSLAGDELVVHGYSHITRSGRDGAETARLGAASLRATVAAGAGELRRVGLSPSGFVAPAYGRAAHCSDACRDAGLRWWAGRVALHHHGGAIVVPSIGLGASRGVRRAVSPVLAATAARLLRRAPVVRLDLHTSDVDHPRLAIAARSLLCRLLDQGRVPATHGALVPRGEESRLALSAGPAAPMQGVSSRR